MKKLMIVLLTLIAISCRKEDVSAPEIVPAPPPAPVYADNPEWAVMLLDFDGGIELEGTWSRKDVLYDSSGLSTEQERQILDSVRHYFMPFKVHVTTNEDRFSQTPKNRRIRAILTVTWEFVGHMTGGQAMTGSLAWNYDVPCWVFTSLHNFRIRDIVRATAHELGHTAGLPHQKKCDDLGNVVSNYNSGDADWAPLMGVPYHAKQTGWMKGCRTDDFAILTKTLGVKD